MNIPRLLTRQWHGYAIHHRHRTNLLLHIVAVPLFMAASALIGLAAWRPSLGLLEACIAGLVVSVAIQGRGHRLKAPPGPFAGPADFVGRLLAEQWVTFPRFVLSGGWWRSITKLDQA